MKFGIGQSVPRTEDPRLITGNGQFTDDIQLPNQLHMRMLRSPYAHGRITELDVSNVLAMPGVHGVYTAQDITQLGPLPCRAQLKDANGEPAFIPRRPILAEDNVLYVGQPIAAVVAETRDQAQDAVEAIALSVDELPACSQPELALDPDTQPLHAAHPNNLCVHYQLGEASAVDETLAASAYQVVVELVNNRVAPSPLEPRASVAQPTDQGLTLYNPSQGAVAQKAVLRSVFKHADLPSLRGDKDIRVISPDTGGGFGIRGEVSAEACLVLFAADQLNCPVRYLGDRSEMFIADAHGRDNLTTATAGFDATGKLTALRVETTANLGAYCTAVGPFVPTMAGGRIVGSAYRIPQLHHSVRCVFTNTMPVAAYRGAGRPEACYVMERVMERAARQLGIDGVTLRKMNFISAEEMPYTLPSGVVISSGEFAQTLDMALAQADWQNYAARVAESSAKGRLRGIGLGYYIETSGGGVEEEARITVREDGQIDVVVGTFSHGQGHRTTYAQILSETLEVDFERINIIQGDTDVVGFGGGTGGSRSSQMGGIAVQRAGNAVVDQAKNIASEMLQVAVNSVAYEQGEFVTSEHDATVSLSQVAAAARSEQFGGAGLQTTLRYNRGEGFTFPNGCHVAEVEIDPETGVIEILNYCATDDCGRVINPLLASGQVHGGVVQGLGQALYEHAVYDDDGQLVSGSFMDYAMPRADQVADVAVDFNEVLDPNNELGVKGIGEGGACAAPSAVVNAVLDAMACRGVETIDMPMTPLRVWQALQ